MDQPERRYYWRALDLKQYHGEPFPDQKNTRKQMARSRAIEDTCDRLCLSICEQWSSSRRDDHWGITVRGRAEDDDVIELELQGDHEWVVGQIERWAWDERCARPDSPFVPLIRQARAGERGLN